KSGWLFFKLVNDKSVALNSFLSGHVQLWVVGCGLSGIGLFFRFYFMDFGFWDLDFGIWILGFGFWDLDVGFWNLDFGFWDLDFGILDFGIWILGVKFYHRCTKIIK